jgi:hypothetical protein
MMIEALQHMRNNLINREGEPKKPAQAAAQV